MSSRYDAVVVGSGPNGLAAAVELARNGWSTLVVEGADTIGGGTRTTELTLPGFRHDVCSAVHPFAVASPYFRSLPLERFGLQWIHPDVCLTHPLDGGRVAGLHRSLDATTFGLAEDGAHYRRLIEPMVENADDLFAAALAPLLAMPRHPVTLARFGLAGVIPAAALVRRFETDRGRAILGGLAAHAMTSLSRPVTSGVALLLAAAGHAFGWPIARGGSASITDALAAYLRELGGEIVTGQPVHRLGDLPPARCHLLDVMPGAALHIAGDAVTRSRRRLGGWQHGMAAFKVDWALEGPIPWADPLSGGAGTVHVGGSFEEVAASERAALRGRHTSRPFVLVSQPTVWDPTRAPAGRHVAWGYCHVPHGSTRDMTDAIEDQIERFAPGFRDLVIGRSVKAPADLAAHNPNYVGGDIGGGAMTLGQLTARPRPGPDPYRIGDHLYLCSAATPPGAGVHGMCGYHAARSALAHSGAQAVSTQR